MIIEQGVVTRVDTNDAQQQVIEVTTAIKTTCGSCQAQNNCSTSVIAKFFTPKAEAYQFVVDEPVLAGQFVELGISESRLLQASFMLYLLPILIFVLSISLFGYVLQDTGFSHELISLALGGLVTMMGFVLISGWLKKDNQEYAPKLCRILPLQSSPVQISPAIPITSID